LVVLSVGIVSSQWAAQDLHLGAILLGPCGARRAATVARLV
jgi:hypothetical protein